jgi:hypothetical protein
LSTNGTGTLSWATAGSSQWTTTGSDIYYTTGKVGINTSSPAYKLQVAGSGEIVNITTGNTFGSGFLSFRNSVGTRLSYVGPASSGDSTLFIVNEANAGIAFYTNDTERLVFPSDSAGIRFPATQSASSDANTLDDYEEGNWTPTLTAGTAPSSVNYNTRLGRYTKIGRQVTVSCSIQVNSVTGGSGDFYISGLPFTVFSSDVHFNGGLFLGQINWGSSRTSVIVDTGQNETNIYVYALGSGLSPTGIPLSEVADTNDYMNFNLTYFAA